jgi:hypothetical protein
LGIFYFLSNKRHRIDGPAREWWVEDEKIECASQK